MFDSTTGGVALAAVTAVDADAIAQVKESVRRRLLHAFARRGLLPEEGARAVGQRAH